MFKKFAEKILTKGVKKAKDKIAKKPAKSKPKITKKQLQQGVKKAKTATRPKTPPGAARKLGGVGPAMVGGALTGIAVKKGNKKDARAKAMDSVTGGPTQKPKKKPKPSKKLPDARDKAKTRDQVKPGLFVKTKKGFLKDKTGKRVKRLSKEELAKKRKNR